MDWYGDPSRRTNGRPQFFGQGHGLDGLGLESLEQDSSWLGHTGVPNRDPDGPQTNVFGHIVHHVVQGDPIYSQVFKIVVTRQRIA